MKIILSNKFYYPKGGDCIYTIELEKLLIKNGHEVANFSMQHPENLESEYSSYFPSMLDYSKIKVSSVSEQILRPVYSSEVKNKFRKLIKDFKPDIVHVNNIHSQLSPIIVQIAYENKIPVVWTLHDYKLLCPSYDCLRDGVPCKLCFENKINVVKYKCIKNSLIASTIAYAEAVFWNREKLEKYTTQFICPSKFMKERMLEGGFSDSKLLVLNNFIEENKILSIPTKKQGYYCYLGRLSKEKGVETLCLAASLLPERKLIIIGTGPLEKKLKEKYKNNSNIIFLGYKNWEEIKDLISKAEFIVIPSRWYENNPLSIIESMALGTPVIGANIGGIPELINVGVDGLLFESGNVNDLKEKISFFYSQLAEKMDYSLLIEKAKKMFTEEIYYENLIEIYNNILKKQSKKC